MSNIKKKRISILQDAKYFCLQLEFINLFTYKQPEYLLELKARFLFMHCHGF